MKIFLTSTSVRGRSMDFFKRHLTLTLSQRTSGPAMFLAKQYNLTPVFPLHYPSTVFPPPTVHVLDYKHVCNERDKTTHSSSMLPTHHKKERTQGPTRRPLMKHCRHETRATSRPTLGASQAQANALPQMHVRMHTWIRRRCGRIVSCMM